MRVKTKPLENAPTIGRPGRPPKDLAAQVDERILDAARRLFLARGLAGVSVEEIAREAHASKGTIYARFATKEALFAAIAIRNEANVPEGFKRGWPSEGTIEERLSEVATSILKHLLTSDSIDFIWLAVSEVRRFPDLAKVGPMMRQRGAQAVAAVFKEIVQSKQGNDFPGFAPERLATTAQHFLDLVVSPLLMRAVFGEDVKLLRAQIRSHSERSVAFFLDACRS